MAAMMFGIAQQRASEELGLMGALGGCGLRIDSVGLADAAFWTSWVASSRLMPIVARARLGHLKPANEQEAQEARARLAVAGVFVDEHGRVEFDQASARTYAGPLQCDLPLDGNT